MRRSMLFTALYLILAGCTLLIRSVFRLDISFFSVLFAEALIVLGIYLVTGGNREIPANGHFSHAHGREQNILFASMPVIGSNETTKYTVLFSSVTIELPPDAPDQVKIDCVFSDVRVILPKDRAVHVRMSAAFSSASMPGNSVSGFGQREALLGHGNAAYLSTEAVFSSLYISD